MLTRTTAVLLSALLGAGVASAQNPPGLPGGATPPLPGTQPPAGQLNPIAPDKAVPPAASLPLDGNWTVVAASRDGAAVAGTEKMSVTIKGGVLTFAGADPKAGMRPVRLDAGPGGTVRVVEANADGKFDVTPAGVTPPGTGGPGTNTRPDRIGGGGIRAEGAAAPGGAGAPGGMTGVYVIAGDYAAVSVFPAGVQPATGRATSYMSVVLKRAGG